MEEEFKRIKRERDKLEATVTKALPVLKRLSEIFHKQNHPGDFENCRMDTCIIVRATIALLTTSTSHS